MKEMQTLTVQITDNKALKALHVLEEKHFIRIVEHAAFNTPALPGQPLGFKAFREWIGEAENAPTIDLKAAKQKWGIKRKQLQKLTK
jgi:hypothetical protein